MMMVIIVEVLSFLPKIKTEKMRAVKKVSERFVGDQCAVKNVSERFVGEQCAENDGGG